MRSRAILTATLLGLAAPASADPLDAFGFDARSKGMGNAATAATSPAGSTFYNPAAAALADTPFTLVGYSYAAMRLRIDDRDARVTDPHGLDLALGVPVRCGHDCTFAAGVGLHLPDQFVVRIQAIPAGEPHFVLLDNDVDRIVVTPALALRVGPVAVGGGVTLLADAAGHGVDFKVGARGGMQEGEAKVDFALPNRAAAVFGVLVTPVPALRLGMSYRGEIDLRLALDVHALVDIPGGGDTVISIRALNFYTPHKLSMGVAFDPTESLTLAADASYYRWSGFTGGVADLRILVDLMVAPALLQGTFPADRLHDTLALRGGFEWRPIPAGERTLAVRGGLSYEPTPVPDQTLLTSFADNDRVTFSIGAGAGWRRITGLLEKPFAIDIALGWHQLVERQTHKLDPALASFSSSGGILDAAVTATASF
jgi:long-chain fatty acid transport protein